MKSSNDFVADMPPGTYPEGALGGGGGKVVGTGNTVGTFVTESLRGGFNARAGVSIEMLSLWLPTGVSYFGLSKLNSKFPLSFSGIISLESAMKSRLISEVGAWSMQLACCTLNLLGSGMFFTNDFIV